MESVGVVPFDAPERLEHHPESCKDRRKGYAATPLRRFYAARRLEKIQLRRDGSV